MTKFYDYALGIITLGYFFFNRNPSANIPIGDIIVSPASGTIIDIRGNTIDIFINIWDVHFQRSPSEGIISNIISQSPMYNIIEMESQMGHVTIERSSGELAKTITTFIKVGDYVKKGDTIGRILLGSHTSITIPPHLSIKVILGQHVSAGETILAIQ